MLMPTCELPQVVNLKGLVCGSGKIDVDSGNTIVTLDKPYQATIVETAANPTSIPVVVNLSNTPIGNNLIIRPPNTLIGVSIQQAARSAAEKTGDLKKDQGPQHQENNEESKAAGDREREQQRHVAEEAAKENQALALLLKLKDAGVEVKGSMSENEHVVKMYKNDNPNLNQIGWGYMSLSPNGNNFTAITLSNDTKALVVVTQDRITDAMNFSGPYGKPQGTIIINQTYK